MTNQELIQIANSSRCQQEQEVIKQYQQQHKSFRIGPDIRVNSPVALGMLNRFLKQWFTITLNEYGDLLCNGNLLNEVDRFNMHIASIKEYGQLDRRFIEDHINKN